MRLEVRYLPLRVLRTGELHRGGAFSWRQHKMNNGIGYRSAGTVVDEMHQPAPRLFGQFSAEADWGLHRYGEPPGQESHTAALSRIRFGKPRPRESEGKLSRPGLALGWSHSLWVATGPMTQSRPPDST